MLDHLVILAAVDTLGGQAAAPWVEPGVTVIGGGFLSLLAYLVLSWQRNAARQAADAVRREQNERTLADLQVQVAAIRNHCTERGTAVDARLARGDTALAVIQQTLEQIRTTLGHLESNLAELTKAVAQIRRQPIGRQPTGPVFGPENEEG